jgi:hypothetical protein
VGNEGVSKEMTAGIRGTYPRTEEMLENYRNGKKDIIKDYRDEIDALLRARDPEYELQVYIKPIYWMEDLKTHPERYPKLLALPVPIQKRYISYFLKEQGRVKRGAGGSRLAKTNVWMLPEMVV